MSIIGFFKNTPSPTKAPPLNPKIDLGKIDTPEEVAIMPSTDGVLQSLADNFAGSKKIASMTTTMGDNKITYSPEDTKSVPLSELPKEERAISDKALNLENGTLLEGEVDGFKFSTHYQNLETGISGEKTSTEGSHLDHNGARVEVESEFTQEAEGFFARDQKTSSWEVLARTRESGQLFSTGQVGDTTIKRTITVDDSGDILVKGQFDRGGVTQEFTQKIDFE